MKGRGTDEGAARSPEARGGAVRGTIATLAAVAALFTVFTLAEALGPGLRRAGMVVTETGPTGSMVPFDDASERAAAFLADRDSVAIVVPWTMTARDLLRLYHLENNLSARAALIEELGAEDLDAVLAEGTPVSFILTPVRLTP